jgi:anti-sigma regulatory factor (Ser/Thr protein kinase)
LAEEVEMREIALHLLDIAENSVAAKAETIAITVCEDLADDRLYAAVIDDGAGMDQDTVAKAVDPFVTSRATRKVGLGLPLLKSAAEACDGSLQIVSKPGTGTRVQVEFKHSHIDRMPLGDLEGTLLTLVVANPAIRWVFEYEISFPHPGSTRKTFSFDSQAITSELGDISMSEPAVLSFLRTLLENGIKETRNESLGTEMVGLLPGQDDLR